MISEAKAAYEARHFREAARSYATLVQVFDDWPEKRGEGLPVMLSFLADSQSKAGDPKGAARTYARLAEFHDVAGEGQQAEFNWEAAARSSGEANQVSDAERYARKAVHASRAVDDSLIIGRAMSVLAQALWRNQKAPEADAVLRGALEVVPTAGGYRENGICEHPGPHCSRGSRGSIDFDLDRPRMTMRARHHRIRRQPLQGARLEVRPHSGRSGWAPGHRTDYTDLGNCKDITCSAGHDST